MVGDCPWDGNKQSLQLCNNQIGLFANEKFLIVRFLAVFWKEKACTEYDVYLINVKDFMQRRNGVLCIFASPAQPCLLER